MPLVVEAMSTTLEIRDEAKIRKLIKVVVKEELAAQKQASRTGGDGADPADPAAAGGPQESGGG